MKKGLVFLVSLMPMTAFATTDILTINKNDIGLALLGITFVLLMRTKDKK